MQPMLTIALRAARAAGEMIVRATEKLDRLTIEAKGANDFVTDVDHKAERIIIDTLQDKFPDHSFLGEESGTIPGKGAGAAYQWIIDPLDGTTNFIHGIPHFAVSIALKHKGVLEQAVVFDPMRQEEFTASRGAGAQLNGKRLRVSPRKGLEGALLGTGFPYRKDQGERLEPYFEILKALTVTAAGIRRPGAATLDLAYVAAGRFDGFWEMGLKEWDMAAGCLLIQEAGGLVADFRGGNAHLTSGNIVAGSPKVFKGILQTIHPLADRF